MCSSTLGATTGVAADFLRALIEAVPYKIHTVLTDNGVQFTDPAGNTWSPAEIKVMIEKKQSLPRALIRTGLRAK